MPEIEIVSFDLDEMDLDDDARALLKRAMPDEPVDLKAMLTDELVSEIMSDCDLVTKH
jgi:hypothetical protein